MHYDTYYTNTACSAAPPVSMRLQQCAVPRVNQFLKTCTYFHTNSQIAILSNTSLQSRTHEITARIPVVQHSRSDVDDAAVLTMLALLPGVALSG